MSVKSAAVNCLDINMRGPDAPTEIIVKIATELDADSGIDGVAVYMKTPDGEPVTISSTSFTANGRAFIMLETGDIG